MEDSAATGINGNQADNSATRFRRGLRVYSLRHDLESASVYQSLQHRGRRLLRRRQTDVTGVAIALSDDGNTLAVGAHMEDSAATGINGNQADNSRTEAGAVYVYTRSGTTWSQQAYIKAVKHTPV